MEYLAQFLGQLTGDTVTFRIAFTLTIALASFILAMGILFIASAITSPLRRRLQVASGQPDSTAVFTSRLSQAMEPLAPYVIPKQDWERNKISERLVQAGFRSENALTSFYLAKAMLVILLPAAVVLLAPLFPHTTLNHVIIAAAIAGFLGLTLPNMMLERRRRPETTHSQRLPGRAGLLVIVRGRAGLNAAIGGGPGTSHPHLAEERACRTQWASTGVACATSQPHQLEGIRGLVTESAAAVPALHSTRGIPRQAHGGPRLPDPRYFRWFLHVSGFCRCHRTGTDIAVSVR
jgi:hypothetical protein